MSDRRYSRFYPVLSRPKLVMGVEDALAIANIVLGITTTMHFKQWQLLPVFILIHFLMQAASRNEPSIRKVYRRYATQSDRYEPFPRNMGAKTRRARPEGWGRGLSC
jgi:type IV secretory pathway TrbD component